ncbi:MAG TPA: hypothetical protein VGM82_03265 [Gemmatimonadaceae bacterium]|jgi:hypothetical protein
MSPTDPTLDLIRNSDAPFRYVADAEHRDWTVRAVEEPVAARPRRSSGRLAFISEDEVRWVDVFPTDWMQLDDTQLFALTVDAAKSP